MRLRSDFWVGALTRRAHGAGACVYMARKGAQEAGAIFICVDRRDGTLDLYGPAPPTLSEEATDDRRFSPLLSGATQEAVNARMASEIRFDTDLWLVDIEDREGRPFVELAAAR